MSIENVIKLNIEIRECYLIDYEIYFAFPNMLALFSFPFFPYETLKNIFVRLLIVALSQTFQFLHTPVRLGPKS